MQLLFSHTSDGMDATPEPEMQPPRPPQRRWEDTDVLSRGQLIEQILLLNPTASLEFLADFSVHELSQYLNHLLWLEQPRTGEARWSRPGDSPAIMSRSRDY